MNFGSYTSSVTITLSEVEKLIPGFVSRLNDKYQYYKPLFDPKSIELSATNGALGCVNYILKPNSKAAVDHFISKSDVVITIKGSDVEESVKAIIKEHAEEQTKGTVEVHNLKWSSRTAPYKEGQIEDSNILTADCTVTFEPAVKKEVKPEENGSKEHTKGVVVVNPN